MQTQLGGTFYFLCTCWTNTQYAKIQLSALASHSLLQDLSFKLSHSSNASPESSHCLPTPVFIKQEHPCLHQCWQTSTGRRKSSPNVPPDKPGFTSSSLIFAELSWTVFFFFLFIILATHRPVRLGSEQSRRHWWGLPPIQASPGCGSVCLRKRRREKKGGGEKEVEGESRESCGVTDEGNTPK